MGKLYLYLFTRVSRYQKGKPIWILLKQQTLSGSGISWAVCKSAPRSRQITTQAPRHSFFTGRMPFLPPNQQRQSTEGNLAEKYSNNYRDKEILEHYRPRINLVSLRRVMLGLFIATGTKRLLNKVNVLCVFKERIITDRESRDRTLCESLCSFQPHRLYKHDHYYHQPTTNYHRIEIGHIPVTIYAQVTLTDFTDHPDCLPIDTSELTRLYFLVFVSFLPLLAVGSVW